VRISLDLFDLLESMRNLKERWIERTFLKLGYDRFEFGFCGFRGAICYLIRNYFLQSKTFFKFAHSNNLRFIDRLAPGFLTLDDQRKRNICSVSLVHIRGIAGDRLV